MRTPRRACSVILVAAVCSSCVSPIHDKHIALAREFLSVSEGNLASEVKESLRDDEDVRPYVQVFDDYIDRHMPAIEDEYVRILCRHFGASELETLLGIYRNEAFRKYQERTTEIEDAVMRFVREEVFSKPEELEEIKKKIRRMHDTGPTPGPIPHRSLTSP